MTNLHSIVSDNAIRTTYGLKLNFYNIPEKDKINLVLQMFSEDDHDTYELISGSNHNQISALLIKLIIKDDEKTKIELGNLCRQLLFDKYEDKINEKIDDILQEIETDGMRNIPYSDNGESHWVAA